MGSAPSSYTVRALAGDGKFLVDGSDLTLGISPRREVTVGEEINGWLNPEGKWGPYLKVAEDRQSSGGNGSNNEGQIIGWAHTLAAFELAHNLTHSDVVGRADEILAQRNASARSGGSPPPASPAADPQGQEQGTSSGPAQSLTGDVPDF
jgi:hypothetical protein